MSTDLGLQKFLQTPDKMAKICFNDLGLEYTSCMPGFRQDTPSTSLTGVQSIEQQRTKKSNLSLSVLESSPL